MNFPSCLLSDLHHNMKFKKKSKTQDWRKTCNSPNDDKLHNTFLVSWFEKGDLSSGLVQGNIMVAMISPVRAKGAGVRLLL